MGLVTKAATDAARNKNLKPPKVRRAVGANYAATKSTDTLLGKFPIEMREKVLKQAVRAASRQVANKTKKELNKTGPKTGGKPNPTIGRSIKTGTAKKWSRKVLMKRAGNKWDMYQATGVKVKAYRNSVLGMTGFRNRMGSQAWILEHGATIKLWGKGSYRLRGRSFLGKAGRDTLPKQRAAMINKIRTQWKKI